MEMSEAVYKRTIDVNLNGAFHCTQAVAAEMIKRGKGGGSSSSPRWPRT